VNSQLYFAEVTDEKQIQSVIDGVVAGLDPGADYDAFKTIVAVQDDDELYVELLILTLIDETTPAPSTYPTFTAEDLSGANITTLQADVQAAIDAGELAGYAMPRPPVFAFEYTPITGIISWTCTIFWGDDTPIVPPSFPDLMDAASNGTVIGESMAEVGP